MKTYQFTITPFEVLRDSFVIRGEIFRSTNSQAGATPVILSHGFMGNFNEPRPYAMALANEGYVVLTYDFVGGNRNGRSDGMPADMTILTEKADLRCVMDYVKTLEDVDYSKLILGGCSQGGFVSGLTAADYPDEVAQLILFYPALCIPDDARSGKMLGFSFDPADIPDKLVSEWGIVLNGNLPREMVPVDAIETISNYPGPVLILYGVQDPIVNVHYMTDLINAFKAKRGTTGKPDASIQAFPVVMSGHGFNGTEIDLVTNRLLAHLKGFEEVLAVDVKITGVQVEELEDSVVVHLGFTGDVDNEWFKGSARPGSEDRQHRTLQRGVIELKADYVMDGVDCDGKECWIHVINRDIGNGWEPTVETNSQALSFVNGQQGITLPDNRPNGPVIHILMKRG